MAETAAGTLVDDAPAPAVAATEELPADAPAEAPTGPPAQAAAAKEAADESTTTAADYPPAPAAAAPAAPADAAPAAAGSHEGFYRKQDSPWQRASAKLASDGRAGLAAAIAERQAAAEAVAAALAALGAASDGYFAISSRYEKKHTEHAAMSSTVDATVAKQADNCHELAAEWLRLFGAAASEPRRAGAKALAEEYEKLVRLQKKHEEALLRRTGMKREVGKGFSVKEEAAAAAAADLAGARYERLRAAHALSRRRHELGEVKAELVVAEGLASAYSRFSQQVATDFALDSVLVRDDGADDGAASAARGGVEQPAVAARVFELLGKEDAKQSSVNLFLKTLAQQRQVETDVHGAMLALREYMDGIRAYIVQEHAPELLALVAPPPTAAADFSAELEVQRAVNRCLEERLVAPIGGKLLSALARTRMLHAGADQTEAALRGGRGRTQEYFSIPAANVSKSRWKEAVAACNLTRKAELPSAILGSVEATAKAIYAARDAEVEGGKPMAGDDVLPIMAFVVSQSVADSADSNLQVSFDFARALGDPTELNSQPGYYLTVTEAALGVVVQVWQQERPLSNMSAEVKRLERLDSDSQQLMSPVLASCERRLVLLKKSAAAAADVGSPGSMSTGCARQDSLMGVVRSGLGSVAGDDGMALEMKDVKDLGRTSSAVNRQVATSVTAVDLAKAVKKLKFKKGDLIKAVKDRKPLQVAAMLTEESKKKFGIKADGPFERDDKTRFAPLALAVVNNDAEIVKLLLDGGARVNAKTEGRTALHLAVNRGHDELIPLLLAGGADAEATNKQGLRPLHLAAQKANTTALLRLLDGGADINSPGGSYGFTALMMATQDLNKSETVELSSEERKLATATVLINHGADPHATNAGGNTALFIAQGSGGKSTVYPTVAKLLGDVMAATLLAAEEGGVVQEDDDVEDKLQQLGIAEAEELERLLDHRALKSSTSESDLMPLAGEMGAYIDRDAEADAHKRMADSLQSTHLEVEDPDEQEEEKQRHRMQFYPMWKGLPNAGRCTGCDERKSTKFCKNCFLCDNCCKDQKAKDSESCVHFKQRQKAMSVVVDPSVLGVAPLAAPVVDVGGAACAAQVYHEGWVFVRASNGKKHSPPLRRWVTIFSEGSIAFASQDSGKKKSQDGGSKWHTDAALSLEAEAPILGAELLMFTVKSTVTEPPLPWLFELTGIKRQLTLQADSEALKKEWVKALTEAVLHVYNTGLGKGTRELAGTSSVAGATESLRTADELNATCADCGDSSSSHVVWASINLGVVICDECSGVHRSLGAHITKVRSLKMDTWTESLTAMLARVGNTAANALWEADAEAAAAAKPEAGCGIDAKKVYIAAKYVDKAFVAFQGRKGPDEDQLLEQLVDAAAADDVRACLRGIAAGPSADTLAEANSAAAAKDNLACVELLMLNGADAHEALFQAAEHESVGCCRFLVEHVDPLQLLEPNEMTGQTARATAEAAEAAGCAEILAKAEEKGLEIRRKEAQEVEFKERLKMAEMEAKFTAEHEEREKAKEEAASPRLKLKPKRSRRASLAKMLSREAGSSTRDFTDEMAMAAALEGEDGALSPASPADRPVVAHFECVKKSVLRKGFEDTSSKVGVGFIEAGETNLDVFEVKERLDGRRRIRVKCTTGTGWTNCTNGDGEVLMRECHSDEAELSEVGTLAL